MCALPFVRFLSLNGQLVLAKAAAKLVSFQELAPVRRMSGRFLVKKS